ncbi:MAG: efflux RND transporter periplasmic adaptor subunit [Syntrophaceae bacterium]|nr:efflux RND transporter periplasmic adaptor subunit [Syntrophaceae bacterium]
MKSLIFKMPIKDRFIRISIVVLCVGILISAGCSKRQEVPPVPPIKVYGEKVDVGELEQTLEVSGGLNFTANTIISAEVTAQVKSIEVSDGQFVNSGNTLLIFDDSKIRETANHALASLQKDEAILAFNRTEWEKNRSLVERGAISQSQYDQKLSAYQNSLAQYEADKALLAKAEEDLKRTKVTAPRSGVISQRFIERGDWVSEGGKLFQLSDYKEVYLEAFVSDIDVGKIDPKKVLSQGVPAEVTVDAYPGKLFKGRLTYVQPVANLSKLFQIKIYIDNPEMRLLQGLFSRGRIVVNRLEAVKRIPLDSLLEQIRENSPNSVYKIDDQGKAKLTKIQVGFIDSLHVQVIDGLEAGEIVVTRGKEILNTGQPVELVKLN